MKQIPILFSTEMVQAILAGRKTQTRRVIKNQPELDTEKYGAATTKDGTQEWIIGNPESTTVDVIKCPYGQVGDLLWVRESCLWVSLDHAPDLLEGNRDGSQWVYKASVHEDFIKYAKEQYGYKWRPSIHMPKYAARIWLKIKAIRIERLQDISEDAAIEEGIEEIHPAPFVIRYKNYLDTKNQAILKDPKLSFRTLWESINGVDAWHANPWVWVIEFERIEKPNI